jgi:predicted Fe-S protein YdhL (DUF1289 family)
MVKVTATLKKCKEFYSATGSYFVFMSSSVPPPSTPPRSIATPCVKVCIVDGATSLCLGCWRTLSEIGGWSGFTEAERAAIMAVLPARAKGG